MKKLSSINANGVGDFEMRNANTVSLVSFQQYSKILEVKSNCTAYYTPNSFETSSHRAHLAHQAIYSHL